MVTSTLTREEMLARFVPVSGGWSMQNVGLAMMYAMDEPKPGKPDFPSVVGLYGPEEKYTNEELAKLVEFADRVTQAYDRLFRFRRGANLYLFDKPDWRRDGFWMRKKLTWTEGPMFSPTLEEAIAFMMRAAHLED